MRCRYCNAHLAIHDVWCMQCGRHTSVLKNDLYSMKSLSDTYKAFKKQMAASMPGAAFAVILGLIPVAVLIWLFNSIVVLESNTTGQFLLNLLIKAVTFSVFIPFMLISFEAICKHKEYHLKLSEMFTALHSYPRYFLWTLINAIYFCLIYIICFGLPEFPSGPILHLVWLVLANYWVAISLPSLVLMEELNLSPGKAIKKSYQHLQDVRWNIYLLALVLAVLNVLGLLFFWLLLIPEALILTFSFFALRDYTRKLIDFELLNYRL
ncbi:MAG: hypothetical protein ABFC98_06990 [Candidatus Cloacimonas sp.]